MSMEQCACCGRRITPYENAIKFPCPNCGDVVIWRCEKCREAGHSYTCIKCDFIGP